MSTPSYDVLVIGSGPAGYVCAIRCAQLGLRTAVAEKELIGGVCLNVGCIPSKALLRNAEVIRTLRTGGKTFGFEISDLKVDFASAAKRSRQVSSRLVKGVELLLRKNNIDTCLGTAALVEPGIVEVKAADQSTRIVAKNVVIATGARPASLPGIQPDGTRVVTYREAILQETLPASAVIVGGGPIGLEFATIWSAYGVPVTVVEMLPRIAPLEDEEVSAELAKELGKKGIQFETGASVREIRIESDKAHVVFETSSKGGELIADQVLLATGFRPNSENLGLEALGVATEKNKIAIDASYRTNVPGLWAIGDVTGKLMLAHVGTAMGIRCAECIAGRTPEPLVYENLPRGIFSQPQVASFGLTEAQAEARGLSFHKAKFPFQANGKALGYGEYAGWVKILVEKGNGKLLGAHLVGPEVTELLPELTLAEQEGIPVGRIARNTHMHPTLSEAILETSHGLSEGFIHI